MHGIAELLTALGWVGTVLLAFALRRIADRPVPLLVILAFWPLILLVATEKSALFERPIWRGFYVIVALMVGATLLGAAASDLLGRLQARRSARRRTERAP